GMASASCRPTRRVPASACGSSPKRIVPQRVSCCPKSIEPLSPASALPARPTTASGASSEGGCVYLVGPLGNEEGVGGSGRLPPSRKRGATMRAFILTAVLGIAGLGFVAAGTAEAHGPGGVYAGYGNGLHDYAPHWHRTNTLFGPVYWYGNG